MVNTDPVRSRSEAFWGAVGNGMARWMTLAVAFVVPMYAIAAAMAVFSLAANAVAPKGSWGGSTPDAGPLILLLVIYVPLLGLFFSVLGAPFLLFQKWIVGPRFPYLRWGYLAVAVYGPLLMTVWGLPWSDREFHETALAYEVIALAGTMIYARIGRSVGLFDKEIAQMGDR